jgi:hypothetical protein
MSLLWIALRIVICVDVGIDYTVMWDGSGSELSAMVR